MKSSREVFGNSSRAKKIGALVSGALVGLSLPPWGWWPLSIIGIAVFFALCSMSASRREIFFIGALFAFAWFALGMIWMWWLTPPGYLVAIILFATFHGAAALVADEIGSPSISRPITHALAEVLRFSFPFGGVPLATLPMALSQTRVATLVSIGGPVLATWFIFQLAATFTAFFSRRESRLHVFRMTVGLLMILSVPIFSSAISTTVATSDFLRVAMVQGGGPQGVLAINASARDAFDRHMLVTKTLKVEDNLDAVIWPENVIDVSQFSNSKEFNEVLAEAKRLNTQFVVGITEDSGVAEFTNAQVVVTPTGEITSRYDKVRRVPFGEYVPKRLRNLLSAIGAPMNRIPSDAVAGTEKGLITVNNKKIAVVISWEAFFSGRANSGVESGGTLLLNPTNGSSYTGTILQTQQLATNSLRARETGRYTIQVATTGFSAFISPNGELIERVDIGQSKAMIVDVPLRSGQTIYSKLGDQTFVIALGALFFGLTAYQLNQKRKRVMK